MSKVSLNLPSLFYYIYFKNAVGIINNLTNKTYNNNKIEGKIRVSKMYFTKFSKYKISSNVVFIDTVFPCPLYCRNDNGVSCF